MRAVERRQLLTDVGIAAAVFAFSLGAMWQGDFERGDRGLDLAGGVLAALTAWPLVARRLEPLAVFAVVTAATSLIYGFGYGLGPPVGFAIALYTLAEKRDETRLREWRIALAAGLGVLLGPHLVRDGFAPELLLGAAVYAAAWFAGDRARLRRERLAELEERALRAEREAERERRLAAAEERTRIARDLHDSAGHAINVILVQAGAARLLQERDPQAVRDALGTIEEVARETIGEIDQLVRVLRDDGAPGSVEPPTGMTALETLAARHRAAGLDLTVNVHGAVRSLTPGVDQAAYRILQEALTNAARHGSGGTELDIAFSRSSLEITVANRSGAEAAARNGERRGHGLAGMRERAALLGGTLEAGQSNGLFRVMARLPYSGDGGG